MPLQSLRIAPGERADVIVDFSSLAGATLTIVNDANAPFPDGDPVAFATTAQVMQIRVARRTSGTDRTCDPASTGPNACQLRTQPIVRLADPSRADVARDVKPDAKRQLILREVEGPGGPLNVFVNNTPYDGLAQSTKVGTPAPVAGSTGVERTSSPRSHASARPRSGRSRTSRWTRTPSTSTWCSSRC